MDPRVGEPLLFGPRAAPLFGSLHTPVGMPITHAALLLPAAGHEYLSSHRAVRQLALRLAERGCLALRMDFHGCGDSSGDKDSGTLAQWCEDAEHGLKLLTEQAPDAQLQVVGLRLGASVATLLAAQHNSSGQPIARLALWDPVFRGGDYLEAALSLHHRHHGLRQRLDEGGPFEVMSHGLSRALVDQLRALDLATLGAAPAPHMLLLDTLAAFDANTGESWRTQGARLDYRALQAPPLWSGDGQVALIPTAVVQSISDWLLAP